MFGSPHPKRRRKPAADGMTVAEAAEYIGGTPERLRDFIRRGCIPSPAYVGGYPVFSREYVALIHAENVSFDGTHPVTPSKWLRAKDPIPPAERQPAKPRRKHPLHGKPGPKAGSRKGGAK